MLIQYSISFIFSLLLCILPPSLSSPTELQLLMQVKASLDPQNKLLTSWSSNKDPCGGSFDGVACNGEGKVANISLQGKGLTGRIPAAIGGLKNLTALYLHFNALRGEIPKEIAGLSVLTDLYLNVNNLSGEVPSDIGNLSSLQVLQLSYNKFSGSIPTEWGCLTKLSVLALEYNQLTGAIPASLGNLKMLTRLYLSYNNLLGPIPSTLAKMTMLEVLDIRNNTLSGNVPPELKRLNGGFMYANNPGLCGVGYLDLKVCTASGRLRGRKPEPFVPNSLPLNVIPKTVKPQSAYSNAVHSNSSKSSQIGVACWVIGVTTAFTAIGFFAFSWYRYQKQKKGNAFDPSDCRLNTVTVEGVCRKSESPLISLEYSSEWDPLAKCQIGNSLSREMFESFILKLEDIERATQWFSEVNFLRKGNLYTVYKGILKDGSTVAIKCVAKTSCKSNEADFLEGLRTLTSLKHEHLVRLRGFCCSKGRRECFLIYNSVEDGNLLQYIDVKDGGTSLPWSTRVSIIKGIAKGIEYLHENKGNKPALVHHNISAETVLIDQGYKPLLSDSGLHKLLANDIVFSTLKASAARGYLAPEYTTTGRITEKSDVYAFGVLVLQILCGQCYITQSTRQAAENCKFENFIDTNLEGKFSKSEAAKLGRIALHCTNECPDQRPSMETVMQELGSRIVNS